MEASIHLNLGVANDHNVGDKVFLKLLCYLKERSALPLTELVYDKSLGDWLLTRHLRFPAGACADYLDTLLLRIDDEFVVEAREENRSAQLNPVARGIRYNVSGTCLD